MPERSGSPVQQPGKAVAVKTEAQPAVLAMHRMRQQLIKFRTMQMNGLRGLLTEYGEVMAKSREQPWMRPCQRSWSAWRAAYPGCS